MEDVRNAWSDVAGKVESLGLKLKLHLEQEADPAVDVPTAGTTQEAFDQMSGRVRDAFDAFGNVTRDEAVVADVRDLADLFRDALVETFRTVGAEVTQIIHQIEDYAGVDLDGDGTIGSGAASEAGETDADAETDTDADTGGAVGEGSASDT